MRLNIRRLARRTFISLPQSRSRLTDAAFDFPAVLAALERDEVTQTWTAPHVVVAFDPVTGLRNFIGPFDDAMSACVFAAELSDSVAVPSLPPLQTIVGELELPA